MDDGAKPAMDKSAAIEAQVGRALHRLRQERALTAAQLAETAGLSTAMISRIENGHVSPSLGTLQALADALSVSVMALFSNSENAADVHHVPAGQGLPSRRVTPDHSHDYLLLGKHSGPGGSFQSSRIRIRRQDAGTLPRYQHEGHVFMYVIQGRASYACGAQVFALAPGDTLSFDGKLPHGFTEITSDYIEFISVSARPQ
ncbi:helix-turn-helix domain-containing protein [Sedimentitalea nanhaiensis]|uniref:Transcriptional regulator, XRE family with cupin sensor n=1 Tax=Sedimentitalea nanhaiensis TaxID=999627 RepID=A0A1I7DZ46_9RHOB|nr:helix-turn-helix transcriptional regulator [Sedimentitalea nanhaiensis]SFU16928.1 transcriptional regulator, XRE family with cupin sensor [Sedimentitalea nanhaiensis]